jgi:hypothetical protein
MFGFIFTTCGKTFSPESQNSFEMTKLQVKICEAGLKQKSGPVGAWSNYPVLWLMHWYRNVWVGQLSQVDFC